MTERLYYLDPYLHAFDAIVERVDSHAGRTTVTLDRTAFYPTSGGQPFDTGRLAGAAVVDVVDQDDGTIAHIVEGATLHAGQPVHGEIDWSRRFDHMQQHTGQHVLSAAFDKLCGARTVSFHLGAEVSTIDLARELSPADLARGAAEANRIVWEDRSIGIRFVDAEEAAKLPLRKEPVRGGTLRLIDVDGFDLSACGGTHVSRTGAIGIIAVAAWERFKGGQRIAFVCGGRALRHFDALRDAMTASVRLLSVLPAELPAAIQRMQADAKDQKRTLSAVQTELAAFQAEDLAASGEAAPAGCVVLRAIDTDANGLKALATAVSAKPGNIVVLVSTSRPALVVAARSADVAGVSAHQIVTALTARFGGRGGGRPELAQAGGLDGDADGILAVARDEMLPRAPS